MTENTIEEPSEFNNSKPPWGELVLYIGVGFGLYFLVSLPLVFFIGSDISTIPPWVPVAVGILNAVCLIGTVYLTGIRREKISWAGLGFAPPKMEICWFIIAVVVWKTIAEKPYSGDIGDEKGED